MTGKATPTFSAAHCVWGGPQTGKTQRLVELACSCAQGHPGEVAVLCALPAGVRDVRRRIEGRLGDQAGAVRVELVRDAALRIMDEQVARELFGRQPRLLEPYEERFLLEDVRASQVKGRRLREVLDFLRCGWSRLADDDPNWIITLEEETLIGLLRDNLRFTGGILPCELGNLAVNTLRASEQVRARHGVRHVLVDDYPLLDRASQVLVGLLAGETLTLSGDPTPLNLALDEYPYFEGVDEFLGTWEQAEVERLQGSGQPREVAEALGRLRVADASSVCASDERVRAVPYARGGTRTGALHAQVASDMAGELRAIAQACQRLVDAGKNVLVVGTNGLWRANVRKSLGAVGLPLASPEQRISIRDFRDERTCTRVLRRARERLVANPHDGVAWRTLVGLGDYVARSAGLERLRVAALAQGLGIEGALRELHAGRLEGADRNDPLLAPLAEAYERCSTLVDGLSEEACVPVGTGETWDDGGARVLVCDPRDALGLQAPLVVFGGFVDGLIPSRGYLDGTLVGAQRERECRSCLRTLYTVLGCAREEVLFTGFTSCSLEAAERLGLHIERIRLREGARVCSIRPSELLDVALG